MRRATPWALLLVLVLALIGAGCSTAGDDSGGDENANEQSSGDDNVDLTQGGDLTIAVITHGDGGSFWAVAKKGAEDAAKDLGVTLKYSESNNDAQQQAQMIEAAVTEKVDGLAVSAPDPEAITSAVRQAVDAGIPVITLNSGLDSYQDLGALTHVGQTEGLAGQAAGKALADNGAKKLLCIIHEQGNIGLNDRCDGAKKGFGGDVENMQVKGTATSRPASPRSSPAAGGQVDRRGPGAQSRHRRSPRATPSRARARRPRWRRSTSAAT